MTRVIESTSRWCFVVITGISAVFFVVPYLWADGPATAPAEAGTPQGFLAAMTNDRLAAMSDSDSLGIVDFDATSDKEKADAQLLAESMVVQAKLEVAARKKWGTGTETGVAHACGDNVPDDDAGAKWTVNGDQARADFANANSTPLLLMKSGGEWKVDMHGYQELVGQKFEQSLRDGTAAMQRLIDGMDSFSGSGDDFVKRVNEEMSKI